GPAIANKEKKLGLHRSSTVQLNFDYSVVLRTQILGKAGAGFKIAISNLDVGRIGIAAQALGIGEGALEHATAYAKEREQFGKPIAHNQGVSFKLADMATEGEAAKLLTYNAAALMERGVPCVKEVSMAKMYASKTATKTAIEAVQVFGGYGYTEDYPVERFFRDAKVTEIYEWTNEYQQLV